MERQSLLPEGPAADQQDSVRILEAPRKPLSPRKQQSRTHVLQKDILEQQEILAKLRQRHRSIISVLGKCLNIEPSQLDRRSPMFLDLSPEQRKTDKFSLASNKKAQNDSLIEQLERELSLRESQLESACQQNKQAQEELVGKRDALRNHLNQVHRQMKEMINPSNKCQMNLPYNALFCLSSQPNKKTVDLEDSTNKQNQESSSLSKNNLLSSQQIFRRRVTGIPSAPEHKNPEPLPPACLLKAGGLVQQQLKAELNRLVAIVAAQDRAIENTVREKGNYLKGQTIQAIKKRGQGHRVNAGQLREALEGVVENTGFEEWMREEALHSELLREINSRQGCQTLTTIKTIKEL